MRGRGGVGGWLCSERARYGLGQVSVYLYDAFPPIKRRRGLYRPQYPAPIQGKHYIYMSYADVSTGDPEPQPICT